MVPLQQQYLTFCFLFPTISFKFVCFFTVKQLRSDVKCAAHTFVLAHQQSWAGKAIIYSTATELHSFGRRNYRVGGARWAVNKEVCITPILFFRMVSVPHKILPATLLAAFIIFLFACDFFFFLFGLGCFFFCVCVFCLFGLLFFLCVCILSCFATPEKHPFCEVVWAVLQTLLLRLILEATRLVSLAPQLHFTQDHMVV